MQALALAVGFLFVSLYGGVLGDLESLLFGNLLGVSDACSEGRTLVVDNGRLTGIIAPSDINRLLQRSVSGRSQVAAGSA